MTDSCLALLGTNTGRVLVYDLRLRQMIQVLEIGDGPVQRIMVPPSYRLNSSPTPTSGPTNSPQAPHVLTAMLTKSHVWFAKVYPDLVIDSARTGQPNGVNKSKNGKPSGSTTSLTELSSDERAPSLSKALGTKILRVRDDGPTNWADSGAMSGPGDGPNQITTPDGQTITLRSAGQLVQGEGKGEYPISMHGRSRRAGSMRARAHSSSLPTKTVGGPTQGHAGHAANVGIGLGLSLEGAPDSREEEESEVAEIESTSPPGTPVRRVMEEPVRMAGSTGCVRGAADQVGRYVVGIRRATGSKEGARWYVFTVDLVSRSEARVAAAQPISLGGGEDRLAFGAVRTVRADSLEQRVIFAFGNSIATLAVPS